MSSSSTRQRPDARPDRALGPASPRRAAAARRNLAERNAKPWRRENRRRP
jgi:hypothetical protein